MSRPCEITEVSEFWIWGVTASRRPRWYVTEVLVECIACHRPMRCTRTKLDAEHGRYFHAVHEDSTPDSKPLAMPPVPDSTKRSEG